jgi:hypothetical protein
MLDFGLKINSMMINQDEFEEKINKITNARKITVKY